MTFNNTTISNDLYPVANGTTSSNPFVVIFQNRDPTVNDVPYPIQKYWLNTSSNNFWFLKNFNASGGVTTANWIAIGGASTVETFTGDDGVVVSPVANNINLIGNAVANATHAKPIFFRSGGNPNEELDVQVSVAAASSSINNAGISSFNSTEFSVDSNGYVSLAGIGPSIDGIIVDAHTAPGTSPVVPNSSGDVTVTGGQVAAGTTTNVIQTNSLAANTYTIQVQRSQAVASSTVGDNGVCHFNSDQFTVDSNGFVTGKLGGTFTLKNQVFTSSGTYTPTAGMSYCQITCVGGGGAGGGSSATDGSHVSIGGGGGAGEVGVGAFSASTIGSSQSVTIGSGGVGLSAGNGVIGSTTSLGSLLTAAGGSGGLTFSTSGVNGASGGNGGTGGTGGDYHIPGGCGIFGFGAATVPIANGGNGSNAQYGEGGEGNLAGSGGSFAGKNASGYGAAGSGGVSGTSSSATSGGSGSAGLVIVQEYILT